MAADPTTIDQAVSRSLRDNLERIQRTSEELTQAINDLVSACASSRASNALPPMIRAQTSAASLSAVLDVLSRFVTGALQSSLRSPFEQEIVRLPPPAAAEPRPALDLPEPRLPQPMGESLWTPQPMDAPLSPELSQFETPPSLQEPRVKPVPGFVHEPAPQIGPEIAADPSL